MSVPDHQLDPIDPEPIDRECETCDGVGHWYIGVPRGSCVFDQRVYCDDCKGTGRVPLPDPAHHEYGDE